MSLSKVTIFKNPAKINAGFRALETIPAELRWRGSSRPLLLLDSTSRKVEKQIVKSFHGSQTALLIHYLEERQPIADAVSMLVRSYHANGCDAIIVGGSPELLDIARRLNVAVSQDNPTTLSKMVVSDHLPTLVAVIFDPGQALHLTKSIAFEGCCLEALRVMPSLIIFDDRLTTAIKWPSVLTGALATLTYAAETLAFGRSCCFKPIYAYSALKAVSTHLPSVLLKPKKRSAKTALLAAEFHAGISAGQRDDHPSWILARRIAPNMPHLTKAMIAALVLPSILAQGEKLPGHRIDLLLKALGGDDVYSRVCVEKRDPWDKALDALNQFLDHLRHLKPNYLPQNLHKSDLPQYGNVEVNQPQ